jgi:hypothetical protein
MLGQQVGTYDVKIKHKPTLHLSKAGAGTYIVKIRTNKGDTNRKIIIN